MISTTTTPFSQRAGPPAVVVGDFPETLHGTRDNTDFPSRLRKNGARLRLARPPPTRRGGAPHGRAAGGESNPRFLAADAPQGWVKGDRENDTLPPTLRGGRSHHRDPYGKPIESAP